MILLVLSPSKGQDFSTDPSSILCHATELPENMTALTLPIVTQQKGFSKAVIKSQNKLSDALADRAKKMWETYGASGNISAPAIYGFAGMAYDKLDVQTLGRPAVEYLAEHLRIVDPLTGWTKASDSIEPYRLEMTNKLGDVKLQSYWKEAVSTAVITEFEEAGEKEKILINVASDEYWGCIDIKRLNEAGIKAIKADFFQDGRRAPGVNLKMARGLFVRWASENNAKSEEELKGFDADGYEFFELVEETKCTVMRFGRDKPTAPPKKKKRTK